MRVRVRVRVRARVRVRVRVRVRNEALEHVSFPAQVVVRSEQ